MKTIPTVHLNGTSKRDLEEQYLDAAEEVGKAIDSLYRASPHGRDYYIQGPFALGAATEEHQARIQKLRDVKAELLTLVEAIDAQCGPWEPQ